MGSNRTKWLYHALALTSVSSFALASEHVQGTARIVRGAPDTLTLQLRGMSPAAAEVEIGGIVVAYRQVSGKATSLQIPLSSAGLPPGIHEATVRLYDARGNLISTLRGQIELLPDPTAPITITIPRHGTQVSGTVPIEVRVSGQSRPYVSFFIDGQVRTLCNYAPYVYHWDTTRERNGWHTIEAWSFDGNQTFKSPITRVFVNNPGGRTDRSLPPQSGEQVGLNEPSLATPAAEPSTTPMTTELRAPERVAGQIAMESRLSRPQIEPVPLPSTPKAGAPQEAHQATEPTSAPRMPYRVVQAMTQPSGTERLLPPPAGPVPSQEASAPAVLTLREFHPSEASSALRPAAASPQMRGQKLTAPRLALAPPTATPHAPIGTSWLPITFGTRLPTGITRFEVLLDARPVPFDVEPRVQHGIPLVAIRQVFEQAGGKVRWDNQRKVATVELNGRTLILDVRANRAVLDGERLATETPLRIVNGRVMVPASLLGKALNAELGFEPGAQQLHINTR